MNIVTSKVNSLDRADRIHITDVKGTNKVSITITDATGAVRLKTEFTASNALRINVAGECYKVFSFDNIAVKGSVDALRAEKSVIVCGSVKEVASIRGKVTPVSSLKERDIMDVVEKPLKGRGRAVGLHIFGSCSLFVSNLSIPCSVIVQGTTAFCKSEKEIGVYGSAGTCAVGENLVTLMSIK